MMNEYGVPEARVLIGSIEVEAVESCVVTLDRAAPIVRAEISLDRGQDAVEGLKEGDEVALDLGYRGEALAPVLRGTVATIEPGRLVRFVVLDRMKTLAGTKILKAFRNVTAHEVMSWCLEHAGVDEYSLGAESTARRHHFIGRNEGLLDVARRVRESWGLQWDLYCDAAGVVRFMPWSETAEALEEPVADLVWGGNLLELQPKSGNGATGVLETFLLPWVRQGHRVNVLDAELWGRDVVVRAERVTHRIEGGGRTEIEWTVLES